MVNRTEVDVLDLTGPGYVFKARGSYQLGEYRHLRNCELVSDGTIRNRRPVRALESASRPANQYNFRDWSRKIVGQYRDGVIVSSGKEQYYQGPDGLAVPLWTPKQVMESLAPYPGAGGGRGIGYSGTTSGTGYFPQATNEATNWHRIVAFFTYGIANFWIIETLANSFNNSGDMLFYHVVRIADRSDIEDEIAFGHDGLWPGVGNPISWNPSSYGLSIGLIGYFAVRKDTDLTGGNKFPINSPNYLPEFINAFIHKDRMWVTTDIRTFFSKAGDPLTWATPDGGFFLWGDDRIRGAVGYRDSIYLVGKSSVRAVTYRDDPNIDASVRIISNTIGGDSCVLVGDSVYFAKDDILWVVKENSIAKFMDLNVNSGDQVIDDSQAYMWDLTNFGGKYLVCTLKTHCYLPDLTPFVYNTGYPSLKSVDWRWIPWMGYTAALSSGKDATDDPADRTYGVFFVNVDLGTIHAFDCRSDGVVQDMYFNTNVNSKGYQYLYIMMALYGQSTVGNVATIPPGASYRPYFSKTFMHYMPYTQEEQSEDSAYDTISQIGQARTNSGIKWAFEIDSYYPDGSEFFVKKYRQLMMESDIKKANLHLKFDNRAYGPAIAMSDDTGVSANERSPYAVKVPINQRARSLGVHVRRAETAMTGLVADVLSPLLVRSMAVTWNPTGRAPVGKNSRTTDIS